MPQQELKVGYMRRDRELRILIQDGKKKKVVSRNYRLTKSKNCEYQGSWMTNVPERCYPAIAHGCCAIAHLYFPPSLDECDRWRRGLNRWRVIATGAISEFPESPRTTPGRARGQIGVNLSSGEGKQAAIKTKSACTNWRKIKVFETCSGRFRLCSCGFNRQANVKLTPMTEAPPLPSTPYFQARPPCLLGTTNRWKSLFP